MGGRGVGLEAKQGVADAGRPHGVAGAGHVHPSLAEEQRQIIAQGQQLVARVEAAEHVMVEVRRCIPCGILAHGGHGALREAQVHK